MRGRGRRGRRRKFCITAKREREECVCKSPPSSSFFFSAQTPQWPGGEAKGFGIQHKGSKLTLKNNFTEFDSALDFAKCGRKKIGGKALRTFWQIPWRGYYCFGCTDSQHSSKEERKRELRSEGPLVRVTFFNIFFPITISLPAEGGGGGLHFFFFLFLLLFGKWSIEAEKKNTQSWELIGRVKITERNVGCSF